jgi:eukaryotic-like serine/threonine-protein kinase
LQTPQFWRPRVFRRDVGNEAGGLGKVWVARDKDLNREVALKEIRPEGAAHADSWRRFLKEAQITGQLEHPNIVPVYELARRKEDDQPFYTMKFVHGQTLRAAIAEFHRNGGTADRLGLQKLLAAFINICQAVGYAHSRGVVHRDLKPENVVMGGFGEVIVLDWGLARMVDQPDEDGPASESPVVSVSPDAETAPTMGQVGTPAYMAPEQVEARHDLIDARTDVYALGGILFEILTGRPPVEGSTEKEVFDKILAGSIPKARALVTTVPRPLEAICVRAMDRDRAKRYAQATDLAEDVRSWVADEPVSAWPEPFAERARRWAKRNRTAVTAAAAALLMGLVGLGAVTSVQTKASNDLAAKNIALDKQRQRAEDREAQAIAAVKKFGDVIAKEPELKNTKALKDLRERLLKEPRVGLSLLEKLANANPYASQFQRDLAVGYVNIGNILSVTDKPAEAMKAYESALAIRRKLADANPSVSQFKSDLADCHNNMSLLLRSTGKLAEALTALELTLAIQKELADAKPSDNQLQSYLAGSHNNIYILLSITGKLAEALTALESAATIYQKLADANPSVNQIQSELAATRSSIGDLLWETGKPVEAPQSSHF